MACDMLPTDGLFGDRLAEQAQVRKGNDPRNADTPKDFLQLVFVFGSLVSVFSAPDDAREPGDSNHPPDYAPDDSSRQVSFQHDPGNAQCRNEEGDERKKVGPSPWNLDELHVDLLSAR